jgi:hypothetical protein
LDQGALGQETAGIDKAYVMTTNAKKLEPFGLIQLNVILLLTIVLNAFSASALIQISQTFSRWMPQMMWNLLIGVSLIAVIFELFLLILSWTPYQWIIPKMANALATKLSHLRWINLLLFGLLIVLHGFFVFGKLGQHTRSLPTFVFSLWIVSLLGSLFLRSWSVSSPAHYQAGWFDALLIAVLMTTFGHELSASLSRITDYPFTRDWSETSRYYYSSLYFSKRIYGVALPLPILHPSEYLVLSFPFLISNSQLWMHRAWQYFLVISMPLITGYILSRRLTIRGFRRFLLIIWIFLYLGIGPVYYHLLIPTIIVLWGYNPGASQTGRARLIKSLIAVVVASIWAGISRVNWFPVPGLLAATLYFLEIPVDNRPLERKNHHYRTVFSYLIEPVAWVLVGTVVAILSYVLYIYYSGNPVRYFATTFTSGLLWHRLLPNPTYPPGVLTGILIVSLPLFLIVIGKLAEKVGRSTRWKRFHPLRALGLGFILLLLLIGGLLVSTKIGGGSNLHNLDAYIVIALVITTAIYFDRVIPDDPDRENDLEVVSIQRFPNQSHGRLPEQLKRIGVTLSVIILSIFTIIAYLPADLLPMENEIARSLQAVDKHLKTVHQAGGEILFISNRHMLAFNYADEIDLIPDYERVFLMEMAMAGDEEYLEQFYEHLKNHRFDLIIVEPLYDQEKGAFSSFGEENDLWVERVSRPILCHYEELRTLRLVHVQILAPKQEMIETCP